MHASCVAQKSKWTRKIELLRTGRKKGTATQRSAGLPRILHVSWALRDGLEAPYSQYACDAAGCFYFFSYLVDVDDLFGNDSLRRVGRCMGQLLRERDTPDNRHKSEDHEPLCEYGGFEST
jgi:hypothetical protein